MTSADATSAPDRLACRCDRCDRLHYPPRRYCSDCGAWDAMSPAALPLAGTLFSWTEVHVAAQRPGLRTPYCIGYVDLDGGPRVLAPIVLAGGDPEAELRLGLRVRRVPATAEGEPPFHVVPEDRHA